MDSSIQIGTISGIPIRIHFTFFLIIPIFAFIIGTQIDLTVALVEQVFGLTEPISTEYITTGVMPYVLGAILSFLLFTGVFLHELAHSWVALRKGMKVGSITLFILGGASEIEDEISPNPRDELPMAIAGPLMSLFLGIVSEGVAYASLLFIPNDALAGLFFYIFGYLGILNIILFVFNLLPAFPMDGGRVLRAILAFWLPIDRATKIAAEIGRIVAIIFGIIGILSFNLVLILIAVFIYLGAGQEAAMVRYNLLLKGLYVKDAMTSPVKVISPDMPIHEVLALMQSTRHLGFPVVERGALVGMVTLQDIHTAPQIDREALQARDIMTREVVTVAPDSGLYEALRILAPNTFGRIPVVRDGEVVGIVTRSDILKIMELQEVRVTTT
ncbi:peptidase M50 [Methanomicrobiaceae archaeon CYW5]|uniref:CBS domain-containing protein n=1 Tax=Methanovulcanius yangii TaxID=1789227 RepID=UPI0029CA8DC5|nr:CBS domain-containing protein [Methanovulcanius yangii]MBT8508198.1 peptidase M50 [Methanovulcanius yangii]